MAHEHLAFESLHSLDGNADHNDDRGAAEGDARIGSGLGAGADDDGHAGDDAEINGAEQGDLVQDLLNELAGRLAGTVAGDESAVLLQVVRNFDGVELDRCVEVSEEEDQQEVHDRVGDRVAVKRAHEPAVLAAAAEQDDRGGQGRDGLREDDGQHAGHVDLHRQVRGLTAVHLAADDALGVLDRDAALGVVDDDDHHDHGESTDQHEDRGDPGEVVVDRFADKVAEALREAADDAREQDDGDTVSDAEFGDLLTQPHDERGARGKGHHDDDGRPDSGSVGHDDTVAAHKQVVAVALDKADADRGVTGDGSDLLLALFAALFAQPFERRDSDAQELDDDGGVDVGLDAQSKDGSQGERAAGHGVVKSEDGVLQLGKVGGKNVGVHIRHGHGIAEPVKKNDEQREEDLPAQLRDLPCVTESLDHLTPPRPFLRRLRSSPWRWPRRHWP